MILQGAVTLSTTRVFAAVVSMSPVICMTPHETGNTTTARNQLFHLLEHYSYPRSPLAPHLTDAHHLRSTRSTRESAHFLAIKPRSIHGLNWSKIKLVSFLLPAKLREKISWALWLSG